LFDLVIGIAFAVYLLCLTSLLKFEVDFFVLEKIATFLATSDREFFLKGRAKTIA
jgi:hypothetical protein